MFARLLFSSQVIQFYLITHIGVTSILWNFLPVAVAQCFANICLLFSSHQRRCWRPSIDLEPEISELRSRSWLTRTVLLAPNSETKNEDTTWERKMDWLRCNKCYRAMRDTTRNFSMTQCGHVYCGPCLEQCTATNDIIYLKKKKIVRQPTFQWLFILLNFQRAKNATSAETLDSKWWLWGSHRSSNRLSTIFHRWKTLCRSAIRRRSFRRVRWQ